MMNLEDAKVKNMRNKSQSQTVQIYFKIGKLSVEGSESCQPVTKMVTTGT